MRPGAQSTAPLKARHRGQESRGEQRDRPGGIGGRAELDREDAEDLRAIALERHRGDGAESAGFPRASQLLLVVGHHNVTAVKDRWLGCGVVCPRMSGVVSEDDGGFTSEGPYDSFLREASRITDGLPAMAALPLRAGDRLLNGRFDIERALGSGGTGVVYAARDHHHGCTVAVKTMRAATLEALHQLRDEVLMLHGLANPNLAAPGQT